MIQLAPRIVVDERVRFGKPVIQAPGYRWRSCRQARRRHDDGGGGRGVRTYLRQCPRRARICRPDRAGRKYAPSRRWHGVRLMKTFPTTGPSEALNAALQEGCVASLIEEIAGNLIIIEPCGRVRLRRRGLNAPPIVGYRCTGGSTSLGEVVVGALPPRLVATASSSRTPRLPAAFVADQGIVWTGK